MKKSTFRTQLINIFCISLACWLSLPSGGLGRASAQNIGINGTGSSPNISAGLDVDFTNKGLLIPRVALTDTADVTTITTPATSLKVYNTNAAMAGGNGVGYYYYNGNKWIYTPAPTDGPGNAGEVLTSQGTAAPPAWTPVSTTGSGPTGCADCITQTAIGTTGTWATCRNSCVAMGAGWRMPTWDEEIFIASGALGTPAGGWITNLVWTSTPTDARVFGTFLQSEWMVLGENTGDWSDRGYNGGWACRCVR